MAKKEEVYYDEQGRKVVVKNQGGKAKWFLLGCGLPLLLLIAIAVIFTACTGSVVNEIDKDIKKTEKKQNEVEDKNLKIGDEITVDDFVVKVASVENVQTTTDDIVADGKKVIKVNYNFENKGEDQVLADDTSFTVSADGKTQESWYGGDDSNSGFSHQVNHGRTADGYVYYEVTSNAKDYNVEMDFMPHLTNYKAKWKFTNSDIK